MNNSVSNNNTPIKFGKLELINKKSQLPEGTIIGKLISNGELFFDVIYKNTRYLFPIDPDIKIIILYFEGINKMAFFNIKREDQNGNVLLIKNKTRLIKLGNILKCADLFTQNNNDTDEFEELLRKRLKAKYFSLINDNGCYNPDLSIINGKLDELNTKLQNKCPLLSFKITNRFNLNTRQQNNYATEETDCLILCLMYNNDCISSILLQYIFYNKSMSISSFTHESSRGKKFNTLLRSVIIIIAPLIFCNSENIKLLRSDPINPISFWLLYKYFDIKINDENFNTLLSKSNSSTVKDKIFNYYQKSNSNRVVIDIPLSEKNIRTANELFDKLMSEEGGITCI